MVTETAAPMPPELEEHMLGHGFYDKHSHAQGAANAHGLPLIARAVGALDADAVGGPLRIAEELCDLANDTLQTLVREGALFADEYAGMAIPTYYRDEREWREPFEDASFTAAHGLVLEHCEEVRLADVYLEDFQRTGDAQAFARACAGFFRAAYEPVLFASLRAGRPPESQQTVLLIAFGGPTAPVSKRGTGRISED